MLEKKVAIISDTHLDTKADPQMLSFLIWFFSNPNIDKYIINGDFWEGFGPKGKAGAHKFKELKKSEYGKKLFPLMRERNVVDLPGNHNQSAWYADESSVYATQHQDIHVQQAANTSFKIMHGHQLVKVGGDPKNGEVGDYHPMHAIAKLILAYQKILGTKSNGIVFNSKVKKMIPEVCDPGQSLIIGHTHHQEIDTPKRFYNSGASKGTNFQWLEIDTNSSCVEAVSINKNVWMREYADTVKQ